MSTPNYIWEALKYADFYTTVGDCPFTGDQGIKVCRFCGKPKNKHDKNCPIGKVETKIGCNKEYLGAAVVLNPREKVELDCVERLFNRNISSLVLYRSPTNEEQEKLSSILKPNVTIERLY